MVLAIAAEMDWEVRQLDVKTAFLYADIEDMFVVEPPDFETQGKNGAPFVVKLRKSFYGLAQSLLEIHLLTVHPILRLGEKALQGQVGALTCMVALDVVRVVLLLHVVDVVRVVVLHLVVDMAALRRSVPPPINLSLIHI